MVNFSETTEYATFQRADIDSKSTLSMEQGANELPCLNGDSLVFTRKRST